MTPSSHLKAVTEPRKQGGMMHSHRLVRSRSVCLVLLGNWTTQLQNSTTKRHRILSRILHLFLHSRQSRTSAIRPVDLRVFPTGVVNVGEFSELSRMWNGQLWGSSTKSCAVIITVPPERVCSLQISDL